MELKSWNMHERNGSPLKMVQSLQYDARNYFCGVEIVNGSESGKDFRAKNFQCMIFVMAGVAIGVKVEFVRRQKWFDKIVLQHLETWRGSK